MEINQLIYFKTIVESGSINKASEILYVTQPSLSKAIHNLEKELGIEVLKRTNKGVIVTEDGKELYQYVSRIQRQLSLIESMGSTERKRYLSVVSYPMFSISELLGRFYMRHREDDISMKLEEGRLQKVIESVDVGNADIGIVAVNNMQLKSFRNTLKHRNMVLKAIAEDTWYANVGPNSPLYHKAVVSMQELAQYPIVRIYDDYFSNLTAYVKIDGVELSDLKQSIHVNDGMGMMNILSHTDAFRFGPGVSNVNFSEYGIRSIPIRNCDIKVTVGWIKKKNTILEENESEFIELFEEWLRNDAPIRRLIEAEEKDDVKDDLI